MTRTPAIPCAALALLLAVPALADDASAPPPAAVAQGSAAPAAGDAALGEKVFVKCRACHQIGPGAHNAVGPELNGVIGRHSGSVADYNYSDANRASGLTWDPATFRRYIVDPRGVVPGTRMSFAGLTREKDVDNILAYLESFDADGNRR